VNVRGSQVKDALKAEVEGLGMTSLDVERMERDLQARLSHPQRSGQPARLPSDRPDHGPGSDARRRRRWVAAVAAAVAAGVAAAVVGALWVRRPQPPPQPAGPTLSQEIIGVWHDNSSLSMVFHSDGTQRFFSVAEGVLFPAGTYPTGPGQVISERARYQVSGDNLVMSMQDPTGQACDYRFTATRPAEGRVDLTPVSQTGPGCVTDTLSSPMTIVRISPASPAGLNLTVAADTALTPVRAWSDLYGVWLLKDTGILFAVGAGINPAVPYRIDHNGTIDSIPHDSGDLTVPTPGQVVLKSTDRSCGDTVLNEATAGDYTFTATVVTDPCHRFAGQTSLHWLFIQ
jgi:hypothetical protein